MQTACAWLLAAGETAQRGPQFLSPSSILALARALADLGQRAAILAIDPAQDPEVVGRDDNAGVPVFITSRPAATLPALWVALGCPRVLGLPNQLAAFGLAEMAGLPLMAWLGEDDLALLATRRAPDQTSLLADSGLIAQAAARITQRPVHVVIPPATQTDIGKTVPRAGTIAVIGAHPRDGIGLVFQLAAQRRDLRFIIAEWPFLDNESRTALFATAAACGNIDWHRPTSPSALAAIIAEAALVLAPAMQMAGHRDWLLQAAHLDRPVLHSDLLDGGSFCGAPRQVVSADAPLTDWLAALESVLADAAGCRPQSATCGGPPRTATETAARLLDLASRDAG